MGNQAGPNLKSWRPSVIGYEDAARHVDSLAVKPATSASWRHWLWGAAGCADKLTQT
jgi:hypothetical protein